MDHRDGTVGGGRQSGKAHAARVYQCGRLPHHSGLSHVSYAPDSGRGLSTVQGRAARLRETHEPGRAQKAPHHLHAVNGARHVAWAKDVDDLTFIDWHVDLVQLPGPASVSSTRRFCARPAGVSFEATGSASPNPRADTRLGLTPCEIMNCITLSARFCDSTRLLVMPWLMRPGPIGTLSV